MGSNRLNGLVLLNIHGYINVKPEEVLELFSKERLRRLHNSVYNKLLPSTNTIFLI